MIERVRRCLYFQIELNINRMPLIGADFCLVVVEGETLFVVVGDDVLELVEGDGFAVLCPFFEKFIHVCPALFIKVELDGLRFVSKYETEKFADSFSVLFVHVSCVCDSSFLEKRFSRMKSLPRHNLFYVMGFYHINYN